MWITFGLMVSFSGMAQKKSKIKGILEDSLSNPLIHATVLLLEESDSTVSDFTRSAIDGSFKFKDVDPGNYLVKTTYLGYIPLHVQANTMQGGTVNLGVLQMIESATELAEVVIKGAKPQIKMRGDTIEYDATTFKVTVGSSVEELLKRLPGIEVDIDGSIRSDGKNVSNVTVDGKSFFGDDSKAATQILPAESISKVQVFDKKEEEEEIAGSVPETLDRTVNLELKEEFKGGGFGRFIAAGGSDSRAELKGNYNRFNDKFQYSLIGVGNNTGNNGLSWNGSRVFSKNTISGIGSGRRSNRLGARGGNAESGVQDIFFAGGGGGFPEYYNGGFNFNYEHNKLKLSGLYYYNQTDLFAESNAVQDRFFQDFVQEGTASSSNDNGSKGHQIELHVVQKIDSLHTINVKLGGLLSNQDNVTFGISTLLRDGILTSESQYDNQKTTDGLLLNGSVIFRKKFEKKGRSLALNASYVYNELDDFSNQLSITDFFATPGTQEFQERLDQNNINVADKKNLTASVKYVEPLSSKFFIQTFYSFSNRLENGLRDVFDLVDNEEFVNDDLSRTYENTILFNKIGSSLRYSFYGFNVTAGLAYQIFDLGGDFSSIGGTFNGVVDKSFTNVNPSISIKFSPARNSRINLSFNRSASEPSIGDLQAIVDNSNPLFIRIGNPNLTPQIINGIRANFSRVFPASAIRFSVHSAYNFYANRISQSETVDENLITTYQPVNLNGGFNGNLSTNLNLPIVRGKLTSQIGFNSRINERPTLVNDFLNTTMTTSFAPSLKLNITPFDEIAIYVNGSYAMSNTEYDINTNQNQQTRNLVLGAQFDTKLVAGFYFNSNFRYNQYRNDRFSANEDIPILNASIYKQFLKQNNAEVRLSIYDAFNENRGFNQGASNNGISQATTQTLGRYVLLSVTYSINGLQSQQNIKVRRGFN